MNDYSQYILLAYGSGLLMVLVLGGMIYGRYKHLSSSSSGPSVARNRPEDPEKQ